MKILYLLAAFFFLAPNIFAQSVYIENNNIYFMSTSGEETQLTANGMDQEAALSANGDKVIFIRHQQPQSYRDNDPGLFLNRFDELWSMNVDGSNKRRIINNNYTSSLDMGEYIGNFGSPHFSPDGKKIYFLSQNCLSDAILYMADADGNNVRRISNAHQLDMVGGDSGDEYYGHLVASIRKSSEIEPIEWMTVILDPDGNETDVIYDLDKFWKQHEKM